MSNIPNPDVIFSNEFKTSCFLKNVITAPNITVGDYTYYDDPVDPAGFERNNVLFNYPEFGDRLIIGKFCSIAAGVKFIMGPANHRISSVTTYPFQVFGGVWAEKAPPHLSQLPFKGDTVVGSDVWIGRESVIMPGMKIGDGAIIAANRHGMSPLCLYIKTCGCIPAHRRSRRLLGGGYLCLSRFVCLTVNLIRFILEPCFVFRGNIEPTTRVTIARNHFAIPVINLRRSSKHRPVEYFGSTETV